MEQKPDYSKYTAEYFMGLGFSQEEAESLVKNWNFKAPEPGTPNYEKWLEAGMQAERERRDIATDARLIQENQR
jgi:hypothetical protein